MFANDFDADAQAIYSLNLGEIDKRDILSVGEDEIPDGDILTAGFPCQPFSNAGNRKGVHDSRGMLYKECLRIIQKKMPKVKSCFYLMYHFIFFVSLIASIVHRRLDSSSG